VEPRYQSPWGARSWILLFFGVLSVVVFNGSNLYGSGFPQGQAFGIVVFVVVVLLNLRTASSRHDSVAARHPEWERASQEWDRAFYCHKDGVVFYPGSSEVLDVHEFHAAMALAWPG
jgi:hypothetical protein